MIKSLLPKLRSYFFSGILVTTPIFITFYIIWWLVTTTDQWVQKILPTFLFQIPGLPFLLPGFGLLIVTLSLLAVGALARGVMGKFFLKKGEEVLGKLPIARSIYTGTKQMMEAFIGEGKQSFREVALIEYPRHGIWSLCFITGNTQGEVQSKTSDQVINVFLPTTPNPTSGYLLFIPKDQVHILDMSVEEGIKMIVSAGIVTPSFTSKEKIIPLDTTKGA